MGWAQLVQLDHFGPPGPVRLGSRPRPDPQFPLSLVPHLTHRAPSWPPMRCRRRCSALADRRPAPAPPHTGEAPPNPPHSTPSSRSLGITPHTRPTWNPSHGFARAVGAAFSSYRWPTLARSHDAGTPPPSSSSGPPRRSSRPQTSRPCVSGSLVIWWSGGVVLCPPFREFDAGRMAVAATPVSMIPCLTALFLSWWCYGHGGDAAVPDYPSSSTPVGWRVPRNPGIALTTTPRLLWASHKSSPLALYSWMCDLILLLLGAIWFCYC
jgi:hypothetical protein